jgi:hypothetical protein
MAILELLGSEYKPEKKGEKGGKKVAPAPKAEAKGGRGKSSAAKTEAEGGKSKPRGKGKKKEADVSE